MRQPTLDRIPATTLLIVAVGDEDIVVGDLRGRQIFAEASAIPPSRKRFIFFRSDRHGYPPLIADHTAPTGTHPRLDNGEGHLPIAATELRRRQCPGSRRLLADHRRHPGGRLRRQDPRRGHARRGTLPTPRILERRPPRQPADRRHRPRRHPARHPGQRAEDLPLVSGPKKVALGSDRLAMIAAIGAIGRFGMARGRGRRPRFGEGLPISRLRRPARWSDRRGAESRESPAEAPAPSRSLPIPHPGRTVRGDPASSGSFRWRNWSIR